MKRVGIIGLGNIGFQIARAIVEGGVPGVELVAVLDRSGCPGFAPMAQLSGRVARHSDFDAFIREEMDLVLEAANPATVRECAPKVLAAGRDFMPMSVGGLIDPDFLRSVARTAAAAGRDVVIPAGAVTGLNVAAAGMAVTDGLESAVVESIKSIDGLREAPYFKKHPEIDLEGLTEAAVVYRGNVYDAVENFPQNVNIAASLALSGIGPERTLVEIKADPAATGIRHRVRLKGCFGEVECQLRLNASPNKRSSYLASLGAIAALKKYASPIKTGY